MNSSISTAIYRLVCKHFNDVTYQQRGELSFKAADQWIDCWVGCASVAVQNNIQVSGTKESAIRVY